MSDDDCDYSVGLNDHPWDGLGEPPIGYQCLAVKEWRGKLLGWTLIQAKHSKYGWVRTPRAGAPDDSKDRPPASAARLETDSAKRKEYPIYSGFIQYFPEAIAEVARLSLEATKKHHPGQQMHWERSKSPDHLDALTRHLAEAGTLDADGFYHDVKIAWRALTNLQVLLEHVRKLPISPGSKP
jgi:hypothetical protein